MNSLVFLNLMFAPFFFLVNAILYYMWFFCICKYCLRKYYNDSYKYLSIYVLLSDYASISFFCLQRSVILIWYYKTCIPVKKIIQKWREQDTWRTARGTTLSYAVMHPLCHRSRPSVWTVSIYPYICMYIL